METLASMRNYNLDLDYDLVKIRYGDLRDRVMWNLGGLDIGLFDSDSPSNSGNEYQADTQTKKYGKQYLNLARYGLELAYFVVSETEDGNWNLVDGFRRLFGNSGIEKFSEQEVLVKVYRNVDVSDWTKLIYESNVWKGNGFRGSDFFDRGFRLSMYQHFGFKMDDVRDQLEDSTNLLVAYGSYLTKTSNIVESFDRSLFENTYYIRDLVVLNELAGKPVVFRKKTRGGYDEVTHKLTSFRLDGLPLVLLALTLGTVRYENMGKSMKEITIEDVYNLFNDESLSKKFHKLVGMSVMGFALNYVVKDVYDEFYEKIRDIVVLEDND